MGPPTGGMMEGLLVSNSPFLGDFLDPPLTPILPNIPSSLSHLLQRDGVGLHLGVDAVVALVGQVQPHHGDEEALHRQHTALGEPQHQTLQHLPHNVRAGEMIREVGGGGD